MWKDLSFWDKFTAIWVSVLFIGIISLITNRLYSNKHIIRYELYGNGGIPAIKKDIENNWDEIFYLDKTISWSKAVQLVDSLNKTLRK